MTKIEERKEVCTNCGKEVKVKKYNCKTYQCAKCRKPKELKNENEKN